MASSWSTRAHKSLTVVPWNCLLLHTKCCDVTVIATKSLSTASQEVLLFRQERWVKVLRGTARWAQLSKVSISLTSTCSSHWLATALPCPCKSTEGFCCWFLLMHFHLDTHKEKKSDSFLFLHIWQLSIQTVYPVLQTGIAGATFYVLGREKSKKLFPKRTGVFWVRATGTSICRSSCWFLL